MFRVCDATRSAKESGGHSAHEPLWFDPVHSEADPFDEPPAMTALKAFIVEDSPVIRENLIAALEELAPVEVVGTAEDEHGALSWLASRSHACDLVIIDIFLKNGSGLGVLRAAHEMQRPMSMVVLSNYATPDMRRKCLDLGASRVFDKSNEIDSLITYCTRLASGETGRSELPPA
jgi:DNA-binding NarL/FixJ family response regulator